MGNPPWHVEYYTDARGCQPVKEWLEGLPVKHEARLRHTIALRAEVGPMLRMPNCRPVHGKIWELRTSLGRLEHRVLYFGLVGRTFVLLHGFTKKTDKTPEQAIAIAEARAADYEAHG